MIHVGTLPLVPGGVNRIGMIEEVMLNQADLVEIVHELKQVLCVKG